MLDPNQPREQTAFRSGYPKTDQIHFSNQVVEKYAEYTKPLSMTFIDYIKAFDSAETLTVVKTFGRQA